MFLKTCSRIFPQVVTSFKQNNLVTHHQVVIQFSKYYVASYSLKNKFDIRLLSTNTHPKDYERNVKQVYYGVLTPQIRAVKIFSLSSSIVGILAQPFLYKEIAVTGNVPVIIAAYSFIGFFTIVTPVLLHLITKKYVTHLNYKPETDSYIAKTVNFFCLAKETEFIPEEVHVPEVPGMFTTFYAKGKALFLDPRLFEHPEHYAKIMGYDKPIDFKLNEKPPPSCSK